MICYVRIRLEADSPVETVTFSGPTPTPWSTKSTTPIFHKPEDPWVFRFHYFQQGSHRSGKSGNSGKILKTFSSQGNQGKTGGFQPKSGKKISNQGTFSQNIFNPFKPKNRRKKFFKTVKPQELSGNCT